MTSRALAANCLVCGLPLSGATGKIFYWLGIGRSSRNRNLCTRCSTHLEEGRLVELTVLFADLSSFTEMTSRLGAVQTHKVVDEYLRLATIVLSRHGGFIDKYIGDAVMAFFNVPVKREDHAAAAVAAADELQRELPSLSARLNVPLNVSIGISRGYARVGRLGSDDAKDYTAIGEAVNQAARLQAQAHAGETVLAANVYESVSQHYPAAAAEALTLKGFSAPVAAYRLTDQPGSARPMVDLPVGSPALGWGALFAAVIGSGCLSTTVAASLAAVFGAGGASSIFAFTLAIDHSRWHGPLLLTAFAGALVSLFFVFKDYRARQIGCADGSCVDPSPRHRRRWLLSVCLALIALAGIVNEVVRHYRLHHVFW
ncbi:MAG: adenylate/guanylate cyclase domain-containing protein [Elusimicrobiota bacterium]